MKILEYPDPRLTAENKPLGAWTPEAKAKVEEMYALLGEVRGLGLAAPQIGWNVRLFIMDVCDRNTGDARSLVVFDPTLTPMGDLVPVDEACLSFPGIWVKIARWKRARLVGTTPEGPIDTVLTDLEAQAAQHEMDHLDGLLLVEKMTPADRAKWKPVFRSMIEKFERGVS